ncbi:MAG: hypothetical protein AAGN66_17485 [Acidobacteriota bacterium]
MLACRQLRLPEAARALLLATGPRSAELLEASVSLAATDIQATRLTPLADALERSAPVKAEAWTAIASLRLAVNDQPGLQRAVADLEGRLGREGVLAAFGADPVLAGLSRDARFRQFLYRAAPDTAPTEEGP